MSNKIVWFKNDLRLKDNEMLFRACKSAGKVLPLYIFDPRQFRKLASLDFCKTGGLKTKFLIESVAELRKSLKSNGADLVVRIGKPEEIIPELVAKAQVKSVYLSKEVTHEELQVIDNLENALNNQCVILEQFWQSTLLHEEDVPWPINHVPQVFTDFRKESEKETEVREEFPKPEGIDYLSVVDAGDIPEAEDLGIKTEKSDKRGVLKFVGGEKAAWKRLKDYFWQKDKLSVYKETRNGLLGADYSSKLSPWLAVGAISAKSIYFEIKRYEEERKKNQSTYWLYFELLWRDFYKYMAKQNGAAMFNKNGFAGSPPENNDDFDSFENWKKGETGEAFIDANMKELLLTGYMSNRGRQIVASYLIYNLKVNWTWGAAWFENRLIDYDPCSNWLNWAYIAGVGNDPRQGRQFNVESQQQRHDPKGEYIDYWL
ncbi:DASH family cryptochrome [Fulvivirga sp. RKSG066]|uniref:DASH family cryptochrome n=1 Tax=Fulvivirga aurantia TaxID=2529383 RepID=UPI0012BC4A49|nr:DASH family cryptochrome [Fulvivirga aurantia]MTI22479.1 DASH family cryptochrome [Fulvivirga aurantia]